MKTKKLKLNKIYFKDNYNFKVLDTKNNILFEVADGVYRFYNYRTRVDFMLKYGVYCGCERKIINNRIAYCYGSQPITEDQLKFLKKRAAALRNNREYITNSSYKCGCRKND